MPANPLHSRLGGLVGVAVIAAVVMVTGCGGAGVPLLDPPAPLPIEVPALKGTRFAFPATLSLDLSAITESGSVAGAEAPVPILSGATPLAQSLAVAARDQRQLEAILDVLSAVDVAHDATVIHAAGTTSDGLPWHVSFESFEFPELHSALLPHLDCQAACAGHAGAYPLCVRVWIGTTRVWAGRFFAPVTTTGAGAGCFVAFSSVTSEPSAGTLFDGAESYRLAGLWDQRQSDAPLLDLRSTTSEEGDDGYLMSAHHAELYRVASNDLADALPISTANVHGQIALAGDEVELSALHRWQTAMSHSDYVFSGEIERGAAGCFDLATGRQFGSDLRCVQLPLDDLTVTTIEAPPPIDTEVFGPWTEPSPERAAAQSNAPPAADSLNDTDAPLPPVAEDPSTTSSSIEASVPSAPASATSESSAATRGPSDASTSSAPSAPSRRTMEMPATENTIESPPSTRRSSSDASTSNTTSESVPPTFRTLVLLPDGE